MGCRAGIHARDDRAVQVRNGAARPTSVGADEGGAACRARTIVRVEKPAIDLLPGELACSADRRKLARVRSQVPLDRLDRHLEMPDLDDRLQSGNTAVAGAELQVTVLHGTPAPGRVGGDLSGLVVNREADDVNAATRLIACRPLRRAKRIDTQ